ncbi:biotin--[acetyl-CoA-carboxylase] ligase [Gillisia limnaea]|uniref:Biotin/acetyl-CoA-carboxylase ligase n=1 Tax=Gillisia limnaea (strain DSM 15749 / LMG 21470 / R-8282) TaxID=865937 RepID=H2BZM4_GILLR|nr:biotin--[acetyl-CoA-carboxylase] ligase [Gillisia limnaea]EHQ03433.1 biotin/acetyl-CoA-carboxylase ligase [Gillisia limnaea DSM 15749]
MRIIKVSATESTNILAREWYHLNRNTAPVCIHAFEQTLGRGQRGASWISNAGENLTFSVLYPKPKVKIQDQFILSAGIGLAILLGLKELKINNLKLKWPNDIMAANLKIGGILIENILNNGSIGTTIIGIGVNINQISFPGLPKASSLKLVSGRTFEIAHVLDVILKNIERIMQNFSEGNEDDILAKYEEKLFRKNKVSTFQLPDDSFLTGIIKGITSTGLLKVEVEDGIIRIFDLKELKLLF